MEQIIQQTWKDGLRQTDYCFGFVVVAVSVVDVVSIFKVLWQDLMFQTVFPMYFTFMHMCIMHREYRHDTHYGT